MKILYVGTERDEAQAIATAVRPMGESVRVSWTSRLDQVAKWTDETSGPRALVVEADPNGPAWRSVLAYAAGHTALPVVVVVPEGPLPLALGAYECIARTSSLLRDLPAAITRAVDRKGQPQTTSLPRLVKSPDRIALDTQRDSDRLERLQRLVEGERAARADLEDRLAQTTAAVRETESLHQLAMAAAADRLARSQSQHEIGMARAAAARDMVDEQFREATIEVERARRRHASAVAEAERLSRREAELSALVDAATTARAALERRLADAESALGEGEARAAEERRAIAALLAERQRELQGTIAEEIDKRRGVEETLAHALSAGDAAAERHGLAMAAAAAQSRELQAALSVARRELESKAADLNALAAREVELTSMLAAATASRETIERRLEATKGTLQETDARARRALLTGEQAAARAAELEEQLRRERAALATATGELADRQAQFDREQAQGESARADLTAQLRDVQAARTDLTAQLRDLQAARTDLTAQLRAVGEARDQAQRDHQSAVADIGRLTEREAALTSELADRQARFDREQAQGDAARAELTAQLRDVQAAHADLAAQLRDLQAARTDLTAQLRAVEEARDQAQREHQSAVADVARLTQRQAKLEGRLKQERATRDTLEQAVADAAVAQRDEQQRHDAALAVAASELADRQAHFDHERAQAESAFADLTAQLRDVQAARTDLTAQLRAVGEDRDQAQRDHQSAVADVTRLTEREAELEGRVKEERATRDRLEQSVADAAAALRDERQQHGAALASAASELADRQVHFERELAQGQSERADLAAQLRDVQAARTDLTAQLRAIEEARDQAHRDHQSAVADVARLAEREAALTSELADRQAHFDHERAEGESERANITAQLRVVEAAHADLTAQLRDVQAARTDLAAQLRAAEEARDQAQREYQSAVADVARLTGREATLTSELADRQAHFDHERAQGESARADLAAQLRAVEEARDQAQRDHQSAVADVARLTGREAALMSELADVWAAQRAFELRLAEAVRASSDLAERAATDREAAAECQTNLEARLARADETMEGLQQALAETRAAALEAERLLTEEANALRATAVVQAARFDDHFDEQRRKYESRMAEGQAERQQIEARLEAARADNHRLFQQASLPMFRCTKDGALTQANRMLTTLVGLRSTDELGGAEFAASVFESPNDLSWLIERCLGSRGKEVTETTWRRKDGTRLLVRLSASATSADLIECGVEDLTPVRVLQDRLSQAHRMEAVGRLAAEVAVTCGNLLRGVHQNTQEWLMTDGSQTASRQRGEMLLEEMSRAAGLLSQLAAYGDEESRRPAVVELSAVVRDIAPVLKRVAGDAVEVQFPASSTRLNVDASAERVQRLLVNLAAYGRERMPRGGRLKIELGTIVVDRHFTAKHPNVRLGPHALVTVTESRRTTQTGAPLQLHDSGAGSQGSVAVQPTVDLGTLQELVGECGGHLWMTVQPLGDMVVKIRLPLLTSYGQPQAPSAAGGRVRAIASWFQH